MNHCHATCIYLSILASLTTTPHCWAQTPAPATLTQFQMPLADATTATAAFLPTQDGQAWLIYATPTGKLGLYLLSSTTPNPIPPTPPNPPIPPTPIPQRLTIAIVEDPQTTTNEQRQVLANPTWRKLATEKHDFRGIIPIDVIEKGTGKPPASLAPFLDRAKGHNLPWCMLCTTAEVILWEGQLPTTAKELTSLITLYGG